MRRYRKYPNRRLYDLDHSRYVTIEDVRREIARGESIEVADSKEGRDITRTVLLQILTEQEERGRQPVLTNRTIEQIIRFYDDRFGSVASTYIEQGILAFLAHQDQYRERMRKLAGMNPLEVMRQTMDFWDPRPRGEAPESGPEPRDDEERD